MVLLRFHTVVPKHERWLLESFAQTFGPTRSGTRNAHASRQGLPFIRTLKNHLVGSPQARFHTIPDVLPVPVTRTSTFGTPKAPRGREHVWLKEGGKKGRIEVTLNGSNATLTGMDSNTQRLLLT